MKAPIIILLLLCFVLACPAVFAQSERDQGLQLLFSHHYEAAVRQLHSYVEQHPQDAKGHFYLALCYDKLKWLSSAREQFYWLERNCKDQATVEWDKQQLLKLEGPNLEMAANALQQRLAQIDAETDWRIQQVQTERLGNLMNPYNRLSRQAIDNDCEQQLAGIQQLAKTQKQAAIGASSPTLRWIFYLCRD